MLYDEIVTGAPVDVGSHTFTREAILDFARAYDPQPFHVDDDAAARSHFGGLIASGWHTAAVWMRLTVEHARSRGTLAGISPGLDAIDWLKPVRPGDTVRFTNLATEKRRLASRPGWALIVSEATGINQHGEPVYRMRGPVFVPIED
ncbi:MAG TPA: MaoC family dehydratase [Methylomirabilota bacterium]|nr:MaoC family dehydratase [Methylomirabilota bacterium]